MSGEREDTDTPGVAEDRAQDIQAVEDALKDSVPATEIDDVPTDAVEIAPDVLSSPLTPQEPMDLTGIPDDGMPVTTGPWQGIDRGAGVSDEQLAQAGYSVEGQPAWTPRTKAEFADVLFRQAGHVVHGIGGDTLNLDAAVAEIRETLAKLEAAPDA